MAAQTGNNYLSGTMVDIVEIPTINSAFSTMTSSVKLLAGKCDNNGHLKTRKLCYHKDDCAISLPRKFSRVPDCALYFSRHF